MPSPQFENTEDIPYFIKADTFKLKLISYTDM